MGGGRRGGGKYNLRKQKLWVNRSDQRWGGPSSTLMHKVWSVSIQTPKCRGSTPLAASQISSWVPLPLHTRFSHTPFLPSLEQGIFPWKSLCTCYLEYSANSLSTLRKHELSPYKSQVKCHLLRECYPGSSWRSTSLIIPHPVLNYYTLHSLFTSWNYFLFNAFPP